MNLLKGYVIILENVPDSKAVGARCIDSARDFGIVAQARPGVWRDDAMRELAAEGLKLGTWDQSWSNTEAVVGNFVAQYRVWKEIAAGDEPGVIMEHDAVVVGNIPAIPEMMQIVTLGRPSFGKLRPRQAPGFYPLFSTGDKIPGAHGYYLTPDGASVLCAAAQRFGAEPVDKFICPQRFRIWEYFPWPIEAHDSFTTIQRQKGCLSKHNWGRGYRIL